MACDECLKKLGRNGRREAAGHTDRHILMKASLTQRTGQEPIHNIHESVLTTNGVSAA